MSEGFTFYAYVIYDYIIVFRCFLYIVESAPLYAKYISYFFFMASVLSFKNKQFLP